MAHIIGHREARGATAEELDPLHAALVTLLAKAIGEDPDRYTPEEASYTEDGPFPFVCQTCKFFLGPDRCSLVDGPLPGSRVAPEDTCRLWKPSKRLPGRGAEAVARYERKKEEDFGG